MFIILNLFLKGGWKLSSIDITVAYIVESSMEVMRKLDFFMNSKKLHSYGTIQNKDVHTSQVTSSLATSGPKCGLYSRINIPTLTTTAYIIKYSYQVS